MTDISKKIKGVSASIPDGKAKAGTGMLVAGAVYPKAIQNSIKQQEQAAKEAKKDHEKN